MVDEMGAFRPGTDQAHVTPQDIEKLRQLIDARAAHEPANPRNPIIPRRCPDWPPICFRVLSHAAELQQGKAAAVQPDTLLPIEN